MGGGGDERRLEAEGRAALGVEMLDLLPGALRRVAPIRGASGAVELEVEAEVVRDRQRRALVEERDEVGRQGRLPGVLTELGQGRGLAVDPPRRRHEQEPDRVLAAGPRLQGEDRRQVGDGQRRAVAGVGIEAEPGGARDLELEPAAPVGVLGGGAAGPQVGAEGPGLLLARGIRQQDRPHGVVPARRAQLPERGSGDDAEQLGAELAGLLPLHGGLRVDHERLAIRRGRCCHRGFPPGRGARPRRALDHERLSLSSPDCPAGIGGRIGRADPALDGCRVGPKAAVASAAGVRP